MTERVSFSVAPVIRFKYLFFRRNDCVLGSLRNLHLHHGLRADFGLLARGWTPSCPCLASGKNKFTNTGKGKGTGFLGFGDC